MNGREVKIVSTSPLSKAQAVEDITAVQQWAQTIAGLFGPQMVNLFIDGAEVSKYLQGKFGVPERLARNEQQRAQLVSQLQQIGSQGEMSGGEAPPGPGA